MKSTILNIKKRVLVMEIPENQEVLYKEDVIYSIDEKQLQYSYLPLGNFKLICKGSELSEEIAKGLIRNKESFSSISDYVDDVIYTYKEKFISAIEASGYYWNNPIDKPHNTGLLHTYPTGNPLMDESFKGAIEWQEAESKTFHPEQVILFEIL